MDPSVSRVTESVDPSVSFATRMDPSVSFATLMDPSVDLRVDSVDPWLSRST